MQVSKCIAHFVLSDMKRWMNQMHVLRCSWASRGVGSAPACRWPFRAALSTAETANLNISFSSKFVMRGSDPIASISYGSTDRSCLSQGRRGQDAKNAEFPYRCLQHVVPSLIVGGMGSVSVSDKKMNPQNLLWLGRIPSEVDPEGDAWWPDWVGP